MDILNPLQVLMMAQRLVPAVKYAVGAAGIAAAISIITFFVGNTQASIRTFGVVFALMILLYVFAVRMQSSASEQKASTILIWVVVVAYAAFISMTVTVFAFEWPCPWMRFLGVANGSACDHPFEFKPQPWWSW